MAKILNILEPIIFPIAILFSFFIAAITEVATSGKEVPNASTPIPIIASLTPKYFEKIFIALFTKISDPKITPNKPKTKIIKAFLH